MEHVTFGFEIIGLRMFGLVKHGLTLDNPGSIFGLVNESIAEVFWIVQSKQ